MSIDSMLKYRLKIFKVNKVQKSKIDGASRLDFFMYSCTAWKILVLFEAKVLGLQTARNMLKH